MHVLPALVNVFIGFFKATSIVVVVGIFDLMTAAKRAAADAHWEGFGTEIYLFVALIYFAFCAAMSWYSARLQARARPGTAPLTDRRCQRAARAADPAHRAAQQVVRRLPRAARRGSRGGVAASASSCAGARGRESRR